MIGQGAAGSGERRLGGLRERLLAVGYSEVGLRVLLQRIAGPLVAPGGEAGARALLARSSDRAASLARMFLLGERLEEAPTATALEALGDELLAHGLLTAERGLVSAAVGLLPVQGALIVLARPAPPPPELLDRWFHPRPVRRAADVGTAGDLVTLRLAGLADRLVVVADTVADLERCMLTAALNGVRNLEPRLGEVSSGLAGGGFGSVVVRGLERSRLADIRATLAQLPGSLAPGGVASVRLRWSAIADAALVRPVPWLDPRGTDAWCMRPATLDEDAVIVLARRLDDALGRLRIEPIDDRVRAPVAAAVEPATTTPAVVVASGVATARVVAESTGSYTA